MAVCNNASRRLSIYSKTSRTEKITKSFTCHTIKKKHTTASKHTRLSPRSNASTCQKNSYLLSGLQRATSCFKSYFGLTDDFKIETSVRQGIRDGKTIPLYELPP